MPLWAGIQVRGQGPGAMSLVNQHSSYRPRERLGREESLPPLWGAGAAPGCSQSLLAGYALPSLGLHLGEGPLCLLSELAPG